MRIIRQNYPLGVQRDGTFTQQETLVSSAPGACALISFRLDRSPVPEVDWIPE